jgi:membrane associated rhomboid family serine protease
MTDRGEAAFNAPVVVLGLVGVLGLVHAVVSFVEPATRIEWIVMWSFVPARLAGAFDPGLLERLAGPGSGLNMGQRAIAAYLAELRGSVSLTLFSYAGLHGSLGHLAVNALSLLAFGSAVARRTGAARFLALFAAGCLAGAITHFLVDRESLAPLIGASAGVSALMGAAARFVFRPGAPLGIFRLDGDLSYRLPRLTLGELFRERRALIFLAVWIAVNIAIGFGSLPLAGDSDIAWQAHLGGLAAGVFLLPLVDSVRGRR